MIDPFRILDGLFEGLGSGEGSDFPEFPTSFPTVEDPQSTVIAAFSHVSRVSHGENEQSDKTPSIPDDVTDFSGCGSRVTSSCAEGVGSVGSVGKDPYPPLQNPSLSFPLSSEKVGRVGNEVGPAGRSVPISPADVRAGVARELRALEALGRTGPDALRDAIEIAVAKIRNSAALVETQAADGRCHVCREPLDGARPEVAVMQGHPGKPLHMHAGCHADHKARRTALVDRIMEAAGPLDQQHYVGAPARDAQENAL